MLMVYFTMNVAVCVIFSIAWFLMFVSVQVRTLALVATALFYVENDGMDDSAKGTQSDSSGL